MMLKMMNPFGSVTDAIPGVGGSKDDDEGVSKEEAEEQEKMRQEAIKQAERERRDKVNRGLMSGRFTFVTVLLSFSIRSKRRSENR